MMALDRRGQPPWQAPAPSEYATNDGMVDAQFASLGLDPLFGSPGAAVDVARIAGVRVGQHELADVVEHRRDEDLVAVLVLERARHMVGGALRRDRVKADPLRGRIPDGGALEEVIRLCAGGE